MDRYVINQIYKNVNCRISVVGTWMFTVNFFNLFHVFESFNNKMLEEEWRYKLFAKG